MKVLMCPPTYYEIPAIENPHMNINDQPDKHKAWLQWVSIANLYTSLGLEVYQIEPQENLWGLLWCANGAWGRYGRFVLSNFRQPIRRPEKPHYRRWLKRLGYEVFELPESIFFEGQGDVITLKDTYLFGYGFRSSEEAKDYIHPLLQLKKEITPLQLVNPDFYHLDTCAMSLREKDALIYFPGAFDGASNDRLRKLSIVRYEVPEKLAPHFVCNSVWVGNTVLLNIPFDDYSEDSFQRSASGVPLEKKDKRFDEILSHEQEYEKLLKWLWKLGYTIIPVYTSEFKKSGAGVRCLILFLE